MEVAEIQALFDQGNKELTAVMDNGETKKLRLFISTMGDLCFFAPGKRSRGYQISRIARSIESVKAKKSKSVYDSYIGDLRKFKKAFTENCHKNLWADFRQGYANLDIEAYMADVEKSGCSKEDTYELYKVLCDFAHKNNLYLNTENRYKTTTILGNSPRNSKGGYGYSDFDQCTANISKHLENKEDFHYYWRSNYDVSVSGKMCEDGVYRAWFSLEYKGCGNGHYYILINENTAVFAEDD